MYVGLGLGLIAGTYWICSIINTSNIWVDFILQCLVAAAFPVVMNIVIFRKTPAFYYIKVMVKRMWKKTVVLFTKKG